MENEADLRKKHYQEVIDHIESVDFTKPESDFPVTAMDVADTVNTVLKGPGGLSDQLRKLGGLL